MLQTLWNWEPFWEGEEEWESHFEGVSHCERGMMKVILRVRVTFLEGGWWESLWRWESLWEREGESHFERGRVRVTLREEGWRVTLREGGWESLWRWEPLWEKRVRERGREREPLWEGESESERTWHVGKSAMASFLAQIHVSGEISHFDISQLNSNMAHRHQHILRSYTYHGKKN